MNPQPLFSLWRDHDAYLVVTLLLIVCWMWTLCPPLSLWSLNLARLVQPYKCFLGEKNVSITVGVHKEQKSSPVSECHVNACTQAYNNNTHTHKSIVTVHISVYGHMWMFILSLVNQHINNNTKTLHNSNKTAALQYAKLGVGRDGLVIGTLSAPLRTWVLVPEPRWLLTTSCNSTSRIADALLWPLWAPGIYLCWRKNNRNISRIIIEQQKNAGKHPCT